MEESPREKLAPTRNQQGLDGGSSGLRLEPASLAESSAPAILYHGHDLLIINKPPDVRMTGDFDVTVERLIRHWHGGIATPEVGLKWVHQLDMATSGVLCVGLSRRAAAAASILFEERLSKKQYAALVYGRLDPARLPTHPTESIQDVDGQLDGIRRVKKRQAGVQYKPASAFFQEYKEKLRKAPRPMEPWEEVVASQRWAEARKVEEVRARFEQDAAQDKARVEAQQAEAQAAKQEEERRERPPAVLGGAYRRVDEPEDSFVVDVPITELSDDFRVHLGEGPQARRARTVVKVDGYGTIEAGGQQQEVTRVTLGPVTGRRHQLRVHLAHVGHPIVGDMTYARPQDRPEAAPRMMLHAQALTLPFKPKQGPGETLHISTGDPFSAWLVAVPGLAEAAETAKDLTHDAEET